MKFALSTFVPASVERVFDISLDIGTHLDSMSESNERAVAGVTSGLIELGQSVTWKAKHFGVDWTMTSTIVSWDRPHSFVDEQAKGPFRRFHHRHQFSSEGSGTRMVDEIDYDAPFGLIGDGVERIILTRYLRKLIVARNEFIVETARRQA